MALFTHFCTTFIFVFMKMQKAVDSKECLSPQYITMNSVGIIQCAFSEDVDSVLWYNTTEILKSDTIIALHDTIKDGSGLDSGEFDIEPNGSLIINNVSLKHEGTYTVIKLDSPTSRPVKYIIRVLVFAKTFESQPTIRACDIASGVCFQRFQPNSEIVCTVRDARPVIPVEWVVRTADGDRNIPAALVITNETHTYFTSRVTTTNPFVYSKILTLLVCKADGPPGLLEKNESLVLLQNSDETQMNVKPKSMSVEKDSRIQLHCTYSNISYLVWQLNQSPDVAFNTIMYAVYAGEIPTHIMYENYRLQQTSLVVDRIRIDDAGIYRCISGNGYEDDVIAYDLQVFVFPDPGYVAVDGCDHQQYCVLEVQPQGNLTCWLRKIYPQVDLDITQVTEQSSDSLIFYDKSITTTESGGTFDVLLKTKYRFSGAALSRLTVNCEVVGVNIDALHLSTTFDLLFIHETDECLSNPCANNGVCINMINKFFCDCPNEFTGDQCMEELPPRQAIRGTPDWQWILIFIIIVVVLIAFLGSVVLCALRYKENKE